MTKAAIPTVYKGVNFRSRLEATWAAFFDLCRWGWDYEPLDLNGYIPDFALRFYKPLLVEVKPVLDARDFQDFMPKLEQSEWDGEILIVGARLFETEYEEVAIGELCERIPDCICAGSSPTENGGSIIQGGNAWGLAQLFMCSICGKISLCHSEQSYRCRVSGCYEGRSHLTPLSSVWAENLMREARNKTQWNPLRVDGW